MGAFTNLLLSAAAVGAATSNPIAPRIPAAPRLMDVSFSGSGCGQHTGTSLRGSGNQIIMSMPNLVASLAAIQQRTSNCQIHANVAEGVPGWALAVRRVAGAGSLYGSEGVELSVFMSLFWSQDDESMITNRVDIMSDSGPRSAVLQPITFETVYDDENPATNFLSKCVGDDGEVGLLNANIRVSLRDALDQTEIAEEDRIDPVGMFVGVDGGPVETRLEFEWVRCDAGENPVDFEGPGDGEGEGEDDDSNVVPEPEETPAPDDSDVVPEPEEEEAAPEPTPSPEPAPETDVEVPEEEEEEAPEEAPEEGEVPEDGEIVPDDNVVIVDGDILIGDGAAVLEP